MILSNVGHCGVAVRGVLMLEDAVFNVGEIGVVGGSAVREESPNRTALIEIRQLRCCTDQVQRVIRIFTKMCSVGNFFCVFSVYIFAVVDNSP